MTKRRLVIELTVQGTEEQAKSLERAIADAIEPVMSKTAIPFCHSEGIAAQWTVSGEKWVPDVEPGNSSIQNPS